MKQTTTAPPSPSLSARTASVHEDVVEAVAAAVGTSSLDLQPPLYEAVDPDALDALVESLGRGSGGSDARITFSYAGHDVSVTADGDVSVVAEDGD